MSVDSKNGEKENFFLIDRSVGYFLVPPPPDS